MKDAFDKTTGKDAFVLLSLREETAQKIAHNLQIEGLADTSFTYIHRAASSKSTKTSHTLVIIPNNAASPVDVKTRILELIPPKYIKKGWLAPPPQGIQKNEDKAHIILPLGDPTYIFPFQKRISVDKGTKARFNYHLIQKQWEKGLRKNSFCIMFKSLNANAPTLRLFMPYSDIEIDKNAKQIATSQLREEFDIGVATSALHHRYELPPEGYLPAHSVGKALSTHLKLVT